MKIQLLFGLLANVVCYLYLPYWGEKRYEKLLQAEKERVKHDTTIPEDRLGEAMILASGRVRRRIKREVRYIRHRVLSPFGVTFK